jgi:peptidoglycan hydrolase-like protein with peptidoglycan-binding domain
MTTRFGLIVALALTAGLAACADDKMAAPAAAAAPVAAPAPAAAAPMTAKEKTAAIQTALNKNGAKLKVDGVAGKKTAAAVAASGCTTHSTRWIFTALPPARKLGVSWRGT